MLDHDHNLQSKGFASQVGSEDQTLAPEAGRRINPITPLKTKFSVHCHRMSSPPPVDPATDAAVVSEVVGSRSISLGDGERRLEPSGTPCRSVTALP